MAERPDPERAFQIMVALLAEQNDVEIKYELEEKEDDKTAWKAVIGQAMKKEIIEKAIHFEGHIPENWELMGMSENRTHRFRFFKAPDGKKIGRASCRERV